MPDHQIEQVRTQYGAVAASALSGDQDGVRAIARAFGYSPEELAAIPAGANLGLSCGNPTAYANLRPGETVVDLGCGGGIDVTPEMIERARANARRPVQGQVLDNVEFHLTTIDLLPLEDDSVDCLVSNCVINL